MEEPEADDEQAGGDEGFLDDRAGGRGSSVPYCVVPTGEISMVGGSVKLNPNIRGLAVSSAGISRAPSSVADLVDT